jgi:hypothetical protein
MNANTLKNRIVGHRKVRASTLKAHPLNPRTHSTQQRQALEALLGEIGLARSVLAYVADADSHLGDAAPLTLIDGHLRKSTLGEEEVEVEILDVNDQEARALLLAIDPIAQLAGYDAATLDELREITEQDSQAVRGLWQALEQSSKATEEALATEKARNKKKAQESVPEGFFVLVRCRDERHQIDLLRRLKSEGLQCEAKIT